jgi:hypothetical protein
MPVTKRNFVLSFLAGGLAFDLITRFLLSQPREALGASPSQALWQQHISTALWPLRLVLTGPVIWLQQDPDPPPPFRAILLVAYWSVLALGIRRFLVRD